MKILRFKNRFWPEEAVLLGSLPTTEFGNEFFSFVSLHKSIGEPVLMVFLYPVYFIVIPKYPISRDQTRSGQFAKVLQRLPVEKIQVLVTQRLKEMFPHSWEEPTHCYITKWHDDEYARGSYSFPSVKGVVRGIV